MIDVITKIFCSILLGVSIIYTINKINNQSHVKLKNIIAVLLITIITYVSTVIKYNSEINILKIILIVIVVQLIYQEGITKSILSTLASIILIFIGDIITNILLIGFVTIEDTKTIWYYMLLCNLLVSIITILIINIPFVQKIMTNIIKKTEKKQRITIIIMLVLSIIVIINLFYNISNNYKWNERYIINIVLAISYIFIFYIIFKDKFEYYILEEKYDALFDYFSELAENIDDLNLTTHEYKNQIAIVGNYIENKKYKEAKNYINDISNSINKDEGLLVNLIDIPTGGLKGLLYYKIIVAKNQKVEIVLDVGKNIKPLFKNLTDKESKIITRIVGVYIDNAISASSKKNRTVNIEIYNLNDCLNFVVSNKVSKDFDISKLGKKGFTTKGKGHGQGLYLVNRLINRNSWVKNENRIINGYYISKLIIDTKNIGK